MEIGLRVGHNVFCTHPHLCISLNRRHTEILADLTSHELADETKSFEWHMKSVRISTKFVHKIISYHIVSFVPKLLPTFGARISNVFIGIHGIHFTVTENESLMGNKNFAMKFVLLTKDLRWRVDSHLLHLFRRVHWQFYFHRESAISLSIFCRISVAFHLNRLQFALLSHKSHHIHLFVRNIHRKYSSSDHSNLGQELMLVRIFV